LAIWPPAWSAIIFSNAAWPDTLPVSMSCISCGLRHQRVGGIDLELDALRRLEVLRKLRQVFVRRLRQRQPARILGRLEGRSSCSGRRSLGFDLGAFRHPNRIPAPMRGRALSLRRRVDGEGGDALVLGVVVARMWSRALTWRPARTDSARRKTTMRSLLGPLLLLLPPLSSIPLAIMAINPAANLRIPCSARNALSPGARSPIVPIRHFWKWR
jgi:hypothetical protein